MPDSRHLKQVREELASARDAAVVAEKAATDAKTAFEAAEHEGPITDWAEFKAAEVAVQEMGVAKDKVADLEKADVSIVSMMAAKGIAAPAVGTGGMSQPLFTGAAALLQQSDEYMSAIERNAFSSQSQFGTISLGTMVSRDGFEAWLQGAGIRADAIPGAPAGPYGTPNSQIQVPPDNRGLVNPILRQLTLLDLISTGATDSNIIQYVQQTGLPLGAAETAELALKPEVGLAFTDATAPIRTIAAWIKMARQALDDVPFLGSTINQQLPYAVRVRLENQIIQGDGAGQNIQGILNTTGIVNQTFTTGDNPADAVIRLMTTLFLGDAIPNFAAVHPVVWQNLLLLRTNEGGAHTGQYLYGGPQSVAAPTLWGMHLIQSRILPQTEVFVGDSNAAMLVVREGLNVKTTDQDQDDFVRNRITVLAEARVGLVVWRPGHFGTAQLQ